MKLQHLTITAQDGDGYPVSVTVELEQGDTVRTATQKLKGMFAKAGFSAPTVEREETAVSPHKEFQFHASTLSTTFDEGKQYFKIRGGEYSKYGVAVYPEALSAVGITPDKLDPRTPHDLSGWRAIYVLNGNGKPRKVVRLLKPQI